VSDSFAQCPNCGTGQDYRFPGNYESTFCFCSFQDTIVGDTEERIIKLLEANHLTAASELIEQDALGENK